jgi:hypothetical protein
MGSGHSARNIIVKTELVKFSLYRHLTWPKNTPKPVKSRVIEVIARNTNNPGVLFFGCSSFVFPF